MRIHLFIVTVSLQQNNTIVPKFLFNSIWKSDRVNNDIFKILNNCRLVKEIIIWNKVLAQNGLNPLLLFSCATASAQAMAEGDDVLDFLAAIITAAADNSVVIPPTPEPPASSSGNFRIAKPEVLHHSRPAQHYYS